MLGSAVLLLLQTILRPDPIRVLLSRAPLPVSAAQISPSLRITALIRLAPLPWQPTLAALQLTLPTTPPRAPGSLPLPGEP